MSRCTSQVDFADVRLLDAKALPGVTSYEAYNEFVVCDLAAYFSTKHCLLIQDDGYILDYQAWDEAFLGYDYIGAPWHDNEVGNGGFSLRSKRFCEASSELAYRLDLTEFSPEDVLLCRTLRAEMEALGIKYAPESVARKFSWELDDSYPVYENQFGFHGKHTLIRLKAEGLHE